MSVTKEMELAGWVHDQHNQGFDIETWHWTTSLRIVHHPAVTGLKPFTVYHEHHFDTLKEAVEFAKQQKKG